jgi:hypothetical protein
MLSSFPGRAPKGPAFRFDRAETGAGRPSPAAGSAPPGGRETFPQDYYRLGCDQCKPKLARGPKLNGVAGRRGFDGRNFLGFDMPFSAIFKIQHGALWIKRQAPSRKMRRPMGKEEGGLAAAFLLKRLSRQSCFSFS